MKTLAKAFLVCSALLFASVAFGQTILTTTTLSAAVGNTASSALTTGNLGVVSVASATGISAPTPNSGNTYGAASSNAQTYLYVDRELMQVTGVSGTNINVIRGVGGTAASSHASSALVFIVPAADASGGNARFGGSPAGSCTRSNELYLPHIQFTAGIISDCVGGQWVNGDSAQTTRAVQWRLRQPETGAQSSGAVFGTNSTPTEYSIYCTEIDMPYSKLVTGLGFHVGTTGNSSDLWVAALYDSGGNLIANSTTAGTAPGAGYSWSPIPFTSKYYVVGPGQYFGCMTTVGSVTATLDTVTTAKGDNMLTYTATGTSTTYLPMSFTPPTSFHTTAGPYMYVY
jgi:hypothetical protein